MHETQLICLRRYNSIVMVVAIVAACSVPGRDRARTAPSDVTDATDAVLDAVINHDEDITSIDQFSPQDTPDERTDGNDASADGEGSDADGAASDARLDASGDAPTDVVSADVPNTSDRNCADVRARRLAGAQPAVDGRYAIDPDGIGGPEVPFVVYCDRMDAVGGPPREYLDVDPANNFRQVWLEGAACQCQWFRRSFSRVRLLIREAPISYAIDGLDFTYSVRTVGPQIVGAPATCPGNGQFPEGNYPAVCRDGRIGNITPNNPDANEYGRASACYTRALGDQSGARVQLMGTGFRVSRFDLANHVLDPVNFGPNNWLVMSVNNGVGHELQVSGGCAAFQSRRWVSVTHQVVDLERDLPSRPPLGESCDSPWLLDNGYIGGETGSMTASAAGLCLSGMFSRNVRYYELRVPARSTRDVAVAGGAPGSDVLVRVLDRCGAAACVADSSSQPARDHTLTITNSGMTDASWIITVSAKTAENLFYRLTALPPRAI